MKTIKLTLVRLFFANSSLLLRCELLPPPLRFEGGTGYIRQTSGGINYANFGLASDMPANQVQ